MSGPVAAHVVNDYLNAVVGALPAGRRTRLAIRTELADGLACAVESRISAGAEPARAAADAIAEFGPPRVVAAAFARQLLAEATYRIGLGLLCGGPVVGLLWVAATPVASGAGVADRVGAALSAVAAYPVLLAVAVSAAALALLAARRRSGGRLERLSVPAAQVAVAACAAGDLLLLAATVSAGMPAGWTSAAAVASVLRLSAAALAIRRVARLATAAR
ncbi:hypothetical protein [Dactylosporangium matsuzakiense]|uniref:Uncharacterized protein n=1 Tax=Dactylosporangium matsuzakiense TaxID=53360 RepID=A0A9W6KNV3_9ACTN|nr:hypothetical protein [Dactylosporangium matsuzakiense]GLL03756.1 hypothetical protein GCM10017581_055020 [Dactylosporangium matsuzakiense]